MIETKQNKGVADAMRAEHQVCVHVRTLACEMTSNPIQSNPGRQGNPLPNRPDRVCNRSEDHGTFGPGHDAFEATH